MNDVFRSGVKTAMKDERERRQIDSRDLKNLGMVGGGGYVIAKAKNPILGKKRVYHGTSRGAWEKIKHEGLRPEFGGAVHGAGSSIKDDYYRNASKGYVHVTGMEGVARNFAGLTGRAEAKENPGFLRRRGKVVKMDMDYDKFLRMQPDPDLTPLHKIPKLDPVSRHIGARGKEAIVPEEIHGARTTLAKRWAHTRKNLPAYVKKHPLRFGLGLGTAGLGGYLVYRGLKDAHKRRREERR